MKTALEVVSAAVGDADVELRNPAVYAHFYFLVDDRERQVILPVDTSLEIALKVFTEQLGVPVTEESLRNIHPSGRIHLTDPTEENQS